MISFGVSPMREPMKNPLLRMFLWVKQAALGIDVVPLVNWILMISSKWRSTSPTSAEEWLREISLKGIAPRKLSKGPSELLTVTIVRKDGTDADSSLLAVSIVGTICFNSEVFSRGGLNGRLVSAPIIRCDAERCESAEMTWMELKAGLSGTYMIFNTSFRRLARRIILQESPRV